MYLFFIYAVWLDEIRSGTVSFNRVANAFEINFRFVFSKGIGLQFLINLLSLSFLSINFITAYF